MRRTQYFALVALFPALFAGKCKDKGATGPGDLEVSDATLATPQVMLQVISMEPDEVIPGDAFTGTIFGSAFEVGATVRIGTTGIVAVRVDDPNTIAISAPPMGSGSYDLVVTNPDETSATLRDGLIVRQKIVRGDLDCDQIRIQFSLDSSSLEIDAKLTLDGYLSCFQDGIGTVRVEGHADERGTTEYNLALGQRRADSIERYLVTQGVSPGRIRTISYGEELPSDPSHTEDAWDKNRRGELSVGDK